MAPPFADARILAIVAASAGLVAREGEEIPALPMVVRAPAGNREEDGQRGEALALAMLEEGNILC